MGDEGVETPLTKSRDPVRGPKQKDAGTVQARYRRPGTEGQGRHSPEVQGGIKLGDQQAGQLQPEWRQQWGAGEQRGCLSAPRSVHKTHPPEAPQGRSLLPIIPQLCPPVSTSLGMGCERSAPTGGHLRQSCQQLQGKDFRPRLPQSHSPTSLKREGRGATPVTTEHSADREPSPPIKPIKSF